MATGRTIQYQYS